jgi:CubicO group peptidase (beta-lactamase class C family)
MNTNRRTFLQQVGLGVTGLSLVSYMPGCGTARHGSGKGLPRSTPEAQGVSSAGILAFLKALETSKHEFHSFMMVRHGHVIAEGWWSPYGPQLNHTMYSMSKSFTSTAIGFAVTEGRLTVEDKVIKFFPDELPEKVSDTLAALRVKDLLTMSVGHAKDSTGPMVAEENWVKTFLSLPIPNQPGSTFLYNSGATYMLSAIVQKLTGQTVLEYLKPRLYEPLGIEGMTWETCPRGINTGGWGLNIRTEGLAKFGQLYLQKGQWNGRQVIPAKWVEEATTFKIQQPGASTPARAKEKNDWLQGYCYQFWRCQNNAFRGDGAFGQFTIVMPEKDAVIAITSESSSMQGELDLVWEHLLLAMKDQSLPADNSATTQLQQTFASLALTPPTGQISLPLASSISGKTFKLESNEMSGQSVSFAFQNHSCIFTLKDKQGEYAIACGLEKWVRSDTNMPGTPPKLVARALESKRTPSKVAASGTWKDARTFEMTWRYYETPHHDTVTCVFEGKQVTVTFLNSMAKMSAARKDKRPVLRGQMMA